MINEERIKDLERRVKELEDTINKQVPWTPAPFDGPNPWNPWPDLPSPIIPHIPIDDEGVKCSNCGIIWKGVMSYSCPTIGCPMGAGPLTFSRDINYNATSK